MNTETTNAMAAEKEMPYSTAEVWRALTESPLITLWLMDNLEQTGFRADQQSHLEGAKYGWQNFLARLENILREMKRDEC
ncbi:MAG: hypothetical protein JWP08_1607 [Bryobacterales bacterium]|jgi:hypothetical protein|nr:hypothetical protein [Bryobacterales bacterium]